MYATGKIDYVESPTNNIQKTKEFFEQLFGWKFTDFGPDYTAYNDGRMRGGFYKAERVAAARSGSVLVVFYTPTLEDSKKKVIRLKGKIVKDIFSFPGGRRFHFLEPGGSEYAIWSDR